MRIAANAHVAHWIPGRLHPFARDVGSIIPIGFDAYARVFHPPYRLSPDGRLVPVKWRDIAAANDRTIAAEMQRMGPAAEPARHSASGETLWDQQPSVGSMPHELAVRLAEILAAHTQTADRCWFAVWEGGGDLDAQWVRAPRFSVPERRLHLLEGAVHEVTTTLSEVDWIYHSPNLWWPDDRAWCVATEIDFNWTYVAGSAACIARVLSDPDLEALPTTIDEGNAMER